MKQYGYGPNGAIMTSLNFFASKFHQVVDLIHSHSESNNNNNNNNSSQVSYAVIDTPGQIEVFTWSASGAIITELLTDVIDCDFAIEWMRDFEAFQDALAGHNNQSEDGRPSELLAEGDGAAFHNPGVSPYMNSLVHSMSLVLDEFYRDLRCCGISSITGDGMAKLMEKINEATEEYFKINLPSILAKQEKCKQQMKEGQSSDNKKLKTVKHTPMLLDIAGNDDEADKDPLPDVDGVELRPQNDSDDDDDDADDDQNELKDVTSIRNKFQQSCSVEPVVPTNTSDS
nr:unnamed protein product [Trichobilharzia regenti]